MPKVKISEYSATANSNTDVASINIDEGCAPSGINNAIRAVMGHLKDFQQGTYGDPFNGPVNGTLGATTAATANVTTLTTSSTVTHNGGTANGVPYLNGSKVLTTGSALVFDGTNLGVGTASPSTYSAYTKLSVLNGIAIGVDASNGGRIVGSTTTGTELSYLTMGGNYNLGATGEIALATSTAKSIIFGTNNTERARIDSSGNVGIGQTAPIAKLDIGGISTTQNGLVLTTSSGVLALAAFTTDTSTGEIRIGGTVGAAGNYFPCFYASGSERMRIDTSGNLLVGKTSFSALSGVGTGVTSVGRINVVTAASTSAFSTYELYSTGAGAYRFYVDAAGTISATSIVITAISDERLKENVRDIDTGLNSIMALKPRRFDWKEGKGQDKKNAAGFIAQEFETVFPECVSTSKAGGDGIEYKNINHETLIPTLVKAIQELKAEFDAYKASQP